MVVENRCRTRQGRAGEGGRGRGREQSSCKMKNHRVNIIKN